MKETLVNNNRWGRRGLQNNLKKVGVRVHTSLLLLLPLPHHCCHCRCRCMVMVLVVGTRGWEWRTNKKKRGGDIPVVGINKNLKIKSGGDIHHPAHCRGPARRCHRHCCCCHHFVVGGGGVVGGCGCWSNVGCNTGHTAGDFVSHRTCHLWHRTCDRYRLCGCRFDPRLWL